MHMNKCMRAQVCTCMLYKKQNILILYFSYKKWHVLVSMTLIKTV